MIPFGIFLGVCSGGVVVMLYSLVGFWSEGRRKHEPSVISAILIPGVPVTTARDPRSFPVFSRRRTGRQPLTKNIEDGTGSANTWQMFVKCHESERLGELGVRRQKKLQQKH